jgi:hypothetical protein
MRASLYILVKFEDECLEANCEVVERADRAEKKSKYSKKNWQVKIIQKWQVKIIPS